MSAADSLLLVGATGLVGADVLAQSAQSSELSVTALVRRPIYEPTWADVRVANPSEWPHLIKAMRPTVFASALGTTWRAAGKSQEAFRAVDERLVLACAKAAQDAGAQRCILVSSVGARADARNFYLRVKGEVEEKIARLGFQRVDILRPGLLRGTRSSERRPGERLAMLASPVVDRLLWGGVSRFRSIAAESVAAAILGLAGETSPGKFIHHNDDILRAAAEEPQTR